MFVAESESGQTEFECEFSRGQTLGEVINNVTGGNRKVIATMIDETGRFRPNIAVFFGSDQQRNLETPNTEIGEKVNEISIFPALSGG